MKCCRTIAVGLAWTCALLLAGALTSVAQGAEPPPQASIHDRVIKQTIAAKQDVATALHELDVTRDAVTAERLPLTASRDALEADVRALREEVVRRRATQAAGDDRDKALRNEVRTLKEERDLLSAALYEYRRALETRAGIAETSLLSPTLHEMDNALDTSTGDGRVALAVDRILSTAASWNTRRLGGYLARGTCLDHTGRPQPGRYAIVGPVAYFASDDGSTAGMVVTRPGSTQPSLFSRLRSAPRQQIVELTSGQRALVPTDVTNGNVLRVREAKRSLVQHVRRGGFVMVPLTVIGLASLVLTLRKFRDLRAVRTNPAVAVDEILDLLQADRTNEAIARTRTLDEPVAGMLREGIEHRAAPREFIEELLNERIVAHLPVFERHLGALAVFGGVAPLLGLLGTVTGMIHTFQLVTIFGTGDARLLSGGISEALITTEFGLVIAIPVLLAHAYLSRRVKTIIAALEQTAFGFVNRLTAREIEHR